MGATNTSRLVDLAGLEEGAGQMRPALEQQRLDVARAQLGRAPGPRARPRSGRSPSAPPRPAARSLSSGRVRRRARADHQHRRHVAAGALHQLGSRAAGGPRSRRPRAAAGRPPRRRARRAVSSGSSARPVPRPTATASHSERQRCARARLASPEIQCESPVRVATLPSSVMATLSTTCGQPVRACLRNGWLIRRAARATSPLTVVHLDALVAQHAQAAAADLRRWDRRRPPPRA